MFRSRSVESNPLHSELLRRLLPAGIKSLIRRRIPYAQYRSEQLQRDARQRFGGMIPTESTYDSPHAVTLGIIRDNSYTYAFNVAACRDLNVRFRTLDIMASDWVQRVEGSGCDAFMATPPTLLGEWRRLCDERLFALTRDLGKRLYPTFEELFLWESKRRMRDWLMVHKIPHPATWVFSDRREAIEFCRRATYPLVCKTDSGASASGIFILRGRPDAERMVNLAFSRGILARRADHREREWGSILLQEHIPHEFEWRIVRIGDHFFCRKKARVGDFASGSGDIGWARPLSGMLDFAMQVTDVGGFRSMAVDILENTAEPDGAPYLVTELQAVFGFQEVNVNADTGRWRYEPGTRLWSFEPGCFHQNACSNLRVLMILADLAGAAKNA